MSRSGGRDVSTRVGGRTGSGSSKEINERSMLAAGSAAAVAKQAIPGLQGAVWSVEP